MNGEAYHVYPLGDLIDHDRGTAGAACVCGPTLEAVRRVDGSDGWVYVHHSLDGRERAWRP